MASFDAEFYVGEGVTLIHLFLQQRRSPITMPTGGPHVMADYKIEPDGKLVTFLKARSAGGSVQNQRSSGVQVLFKSIDETAEFVRTGESHGFTFEGKEFLARAS